MIITDYTEETQTYWRTESGNTAILPSVNNFKIIQDDNNKAILHLTWDALDIPNFSHYQIRCSKEWKLDEIDKHSKVIDNIKTTSIDFYLTDYRNGIADVTFWIAAYDLEKNRSQTPTMIKGIFKLFPDPVNNLKVEQDIEIKDEINISWSYDNVDNNSLERFLITIKEEDCPVENTYVSKEDRSYMYYANHNGLLEVTVAPQNKDGAILQKPIKNFYMINLNPEPVKSLNAEKDEYGLIHITYEDPIENHISDNKFNFEIIITKEDNIVHNLKATKNNDNQNLKDAFLNNDNTSLDSVVLLSEKSNHQGTVIYQEVQKALEKVIALPEDGVYRIDVIAHKHGWYVDKNGVKKTYNYTSDKSSIFIVVSPEDSFLLSRG